MEQCVVMHTLHICSHPERKHIWIVLESEENRMYSVMCKLHSAIHWKALQLKK
jgi:hypothetical protein